MILLLNNKYVCKYFYIKNKNFKKVVWHFKLKNPFRLITIIYGLMLNLSSSSLILAKNNFYKNHFTKINISTIIYLNNNFTFINL